MVLNFRHFYIVWLLLFICQTSFAQDADKTVTITVSGSGKTQEEAKQIALRSAIEQAFGTFISSKTEVLNDQSVSDEITSVTNGNIQNYTIINAAQLPDSTWGLTLKAVVSIDKLTKFVQAKGITIQIKGGLFALNIKQQILNEQAEIKAIYSLVGILHEPMQQSFDYVIKSSEPKALDVESKNWEIPLVVTATANKNMDFCANYFYKTLSSIGLSAEEVASYKSLNKPVYPIIVNIKGLSDTFYLRKITSLSALNSFQSNWEFYTRSFCVKSGLDDSIGKGKGTFHDFCLILNRERQSNIPSGLVFNYLNSGSNAATFSYKDIRTLSQIENMSSYTVKPVGVHSQFKQGGFVVYEKNGVGLVVSLYDLGLCSLDSARILCDNFEMNGYNDWYLPSISELEYLNDNFYSNKLGGFESINNNFQYWSRSYGEDREVSNPKIFDINYGKGDYLLNFKYHSELSNTRPIRFYNIDGSKFDLNTYHFQKFKNLVGDIKVQSVDSQFACFEYERDIKLTFDEYESKTVKFNYKYIFSDSFLVLEERMPKIHELTSSSFVVSKYPDSLINKYLINIKSNISLACNFYENYELNPESKSYIIKLFQVLTNINIYKINLIRTFSFETDNEFVIQATFPDRNFEKTIIFEYYNKNSGLLTKKIIKKNFGDQKPLTVEYFDYNYVKEFKFKLPFKISYKEFGSKDSSILNLKNFTKNQILNSLFYTEL